jgi:hypothetical protein
MVVGDRDCADARFLEPLNNLLIRNGRILIVEGSRRVEVQVPSPPKRTTITKWHDDLPLRKASAPKPTCLVEEVLSIDTPRLGYFLFSTQVAQMILALRRTGLHPLSSVTVTPME